MLLDSEILGFGDRKIQLFQLLLFGQGQVNTARVRYNHMQRN